MGLLSQLEAREQSRRAVTRTTTGSPSRQPAASPPASIWNEREFIISVTTAPPACRMMLLTADHWLTETGETMHEVERLQVIGIETSIRRHWCRRDPPPDYDQRRYSSEGEAGKHDYRFQSEEVRHDPLIVSPDFDAEIVALSDFKGSRPSSAIYKLIICDWPAGEDDARLAPIIAELEDMVTLAAHAQLAIVAVAKTSIDKPATAAAAKSAKSGPRC